MVVYVQELGIYCKDVYCCLRTGKSKHVKRVVRFLVMLLIVFPQEVFLSSGTSTTLWWYAYCYAYCYALYIDFNVVRWVSIIYMLVVAATFLAGSIVIRVPPELTLRNDGTHGSLPRTLPLQGKQQPSYTLCCPRANGEAVIKLLVNNIQTHLDMLCILCNACDAVQMNNDVQPFDILLKGGTASSIRVLKIMGPYWGRLLFWMFCGGDLDVEVLFKD